MNRHLIGQWPLNGAWTDEWRPRSYRVSRIGGRYRVMQSSLGLKVGRRANRWPPRRGHRQQNGRAGELGAGFGVWLGGGAEGLSPAGPHNGRARERARERERERPGHCSGNAGRIIIVGPGTRSLIIRRRGRLRPAAAFRQLSRTAPADPP